ncbi:hypothetical protein [Streptomyces sviceus]|uniref:hypothetical protein n=1 Tax=Streptomyces sviceus TaxID=285530 RepID=UPI003320AA84
MPRPVALPIAVGYLRVDPTAPDGEVEEQEAQLHDYAKQRDFDLRHIEWERTGVIALGRLVGLVEKYRAEHVLVLSMENITNHPIVELVIREAVCLDAGAELHEVAVPLS